MTQRTIEEIESWALKIAEQYKKELIDSPHYLYSENGIKMSSNGEEKGRYQVAVDLCLFLGFQDEI